MIEENVRQELNKLCMKLKKITGAPLKVCMKAAKESNDLESAITIIRESMPDLTIVEKNVKHRDFRYFYHDADGKVSILIVSSSDDTGMAIRSQILGGRSQDLLSRLHNGSIARYHKDEDKPIDEINDFEKECRSVLKENIAVRSYIKSNHGGQVIIYGHGKADGGGWLKGLVIASLKSGDQNVRFAVNLHAIESSKGPGNGKFTIIGKDSKQMFIPMILDKGCLRDVYGEVELCIVAY